MIHYRTSVYVLCVCLFFTLILAGYSLWKRSQPPEFTCKANFVQHNTDEQLNISLTYRIKKDSGLLSMNGYSVNDKTKRFNRKIFFNIQRKNNTYHLTSVTNVIFPDESISSSWLEKYEPLFFIYPQKDIYVKMIEQQHSYLFIFSTLPAYVCHKQDDI
ncbi:hypothetical protein [Raoultella ornithinolytica]|uniref:hypothetical protein n=1 Tax=Raoultella ornithinolytica TaxID=54291 RepID=UPI0015DC13DE|nr:hypothetical protein [Raoultella ornithinolytica]QLK23485.1 hypothetical protein GPJ66_22975 [Raoultella ornithinolytica]